VTRLRAGVLGAAASLALATRSSRTGDRQPRPFTPGAPQTCLNPHPRAADNAPVTPNAHGRSVDAPQVLGYSRAAFDAAVLAAASGHPASVRPARRFEAGHPGQSGLTERAAAAPDAVNEALGQVPAGDVPVGSFALSGTSEARS
jgi:hypothetical protein